MKIKTSFKQFINEELSNADISGTMDTSKFCELTSILTGKKINIYQNKYGETKKWYDTEFVKCNEITPNTEYTVFFDGLQDFTFKTGKNSDSFIKSFINQFISKAKVYNIQSLEFKTKEEKRYLIESNINSGSNFNRLSKHVYYTTLYGIGMFAFFMNNDTFQKYKSLLDAHLKSTNTNYTNEYSEAGWVYRWIIKSDINHHNLILNSLN